MGTPCYLNDLNGNTRASISINWEVSQRVLSPKWSREFCSHLFSDSNPQVYFHGQIHPWALSCGQLCQAVTHKSHSTLPHTTYCLGKFSSASLSPRFFHLSRSTSSNEASALLTFFPPYTMSSPPVADKHETCVDRVQTDGTDIREKESGNLGTCGVTLVDSELGQGTSGRHQHSKTKHSPLRSWPCQ